MDLLGNKILVIAIAAVTFGVIRESFLLLKASRKKNITAPNNTQSLWVDSAIEDSFVMSAPKPIPFQMDGKRWIETQALPERQRDQRYAFATYEHSPHQTSLQAFDHLMEQLEPAKGRRLVIAEFEDHERDSGFPEVLKRKTDLKNIICRDMWDDTDLIPRAHISQVHTFPAQKVKALADSMVGAYDEIIVYDKPEKRNEWDLFFDQSNTPRPSLYESREV